MSIKNRATDQLQRANMKVELVPCGVRVPPNGPDRTVASPQNQRQLR